MGCVLGLWATLAMAGKRRTNPTAAVISATHQAIVQKFVRAVNDQNYGAIGPESDYRSFGLVNMGAKLRIPAEVDSEHPLLVCTDNR